MGEFQAPGSRCLRCTAALALSLTSAIFRRGAIALGAALIAATLLGAPASAEASTPAFDFSVGATGSGNGQFLEPSGVATDSEGNVWIADRGNNRIQKLDATGKYLDQAGSFGSGNGLRKDDANGSKHGE